MSQESQVDPQGAAVQQLENGVHGSRVDKDESDSAEVTEESKCVPKEGSEVNKDESDSAEVTEEGKCVPKEGSEVDKDESDSAEVTEEKRFWNQRRHEKPQANNTGLKQETSSTDQETVKKLLEEKDRELEEKDRELKEKDRELEEKDRELKALKEEQETNKRFMKELDHQYSSEHEELKKEFKYLIANSGIWSKLEAQFEDSFDAKCFLSNLFLEGYTKSKEELFKFITEKLENLYTVNENVSDEMKEMSRGFGLLLHSTGAKEELHMSTILPIIEAAMKEKIPKLDERAKTPLEDVDLPLKEVAELTWRFVTQPCPIVVCQPETFDPEVHDKYPKRFDEGSKSPLLYARPVVYYNYRGHVMFRGLVGNKHDI